jgi:hypothetical protein
VFDVTDAGLWDGRPSLGGVWVAHPDATDPERVMIRNTETGSFVIGALFRRERENPGPRFQISSDAAAALDILAGAPTELQVIALRREEVAPAEAPIAVAAVEPILETEVASAPESASETMCRACGIRPRRGVRRRDGGNGCAPLPAPVCSRARRGRASAQHVGRGRHGRHHPRRLQPR